MRNVLIIVAAIAVLSSVLVGCNKEELSSRPTPVATGKVSFVTPVATGKQNGKPKATSASRPLGSL